MAMAVSSSSSSSPPLHFSTSLLQTKPNPNFQIRFPNRKRRSPPSIMAITSKEDLGNQSETPRLVTFLGKGGSGKTTSSVLAAQFYSSKGFNTCLVIHSQDPTAEYLMGCKIGPAPTVCMNNLSAVRLETTKMLLEPLNQLKQADARVKLTQGVLEGVVGEELGVLPGMDSIFTALALEKLVGFLGTTQAKTKNLQKPFDLIIYDGISNEETLRMIGMVEKSRWYLKYVRNVAEKTDVGRLTAPSLLRLVEEAMKLNGTGGFRLDGKMSSEIWVDIDQMLERVSLFFLEPSKFGCYLVMNLNSPMSVKSALRYWGGAIQSGASVSGAFGIGADSSETTENYFSPLPFALMPYISADSPIDWDGVVLKEDVEHLLFVDANNNKLQPSVEFDDAKKSVTLFMPGFDKSEIKLYQYRGGSELLVEAGDQRRVIRLPPKIQGKVAGARFTDKNLIITMR